MFMLCLRITTVLCLFVCSLLLINFYSLFERVLFLCFVTVIDLILCFRRDALIELGSHYANRTFYVFFVFRIISGPRVKFVQ